MRSLPVPITPDNRPGSPPTKLIRAAMERPRQALAARFRNANFEANLGLRFSPPHSMTVESSLIQQAASVRIDGTAEDFRLALGREDLFSHGWRWQDLSTVGPYKVQPNDFESVAPPRLLPPQQRQLVGLARWPDPSYNHEQELVQRQYGENFHAMTHDAGERLRNGQITHFDQLWTYARNARAYMDVSKSYPPNQPTPEHIGAVFQEGNRLTAGDSYVFLGPRPDSSFHRFVTPISGQYAYILSRLQNVPAERLSAKRHRVDEFHSFAIQLHRVAEKLDNVTLALTQIAYAVDRRGRRLEEPVATMVHTDAQTSAAIVDHVRHLQFERLMACPRPLEALLPRLAELHFWLAHAAPDARGSAAKAEMVVRAIALAHGFDLPPFKRGFVPDMEAFVTPLRRYVKQYAFQFEDSDVPPGSGGATPPPESEAGPSSPHAG